MTQARPDLTEKIRDIPHKPGVYLMRDRLKRVIYIGKARNLKNRLSYYFLPSRKTTGDPKTKALIDSIWDLEWHVVRSEAEAVLYEGRLIKEFRPKYNISFRDDKRFLLVRVDPREPFPRFQLTRLRKEDGARYFGPFAHSGALRSTLNAIRKKFGIRACRPRLPTERDFKHCLDHIIKNCSAPCIYKISQEAYQASVQAACEFLEGQSKEMTKSVREEMERASERLDFEKAAQLRDLLRDLETTARPMTRFTRKSLPTVLRPEEDLLALKEALKLDRIPHIMECFDISNITSTHIVASMVRFREGVADRASYRRYRIRGVPHQNDFASMAEVVRRRYSRALREAAGTCEFSQETPLEQIKRSASNQLLLPDLIIVDGGRGQLNMACAELQKLELYEIPIIGLAKEFEEVYVPNILHPLRLPEHSGALRLLQRIRDEAHRFANAYHSLLLKRRMTESVLDEVPGVSEARKKILLEKFGSVARLKKAKIEEIAALPGIGEKLATQLRIYFDSKAE
ncbi:MAG: excinuclease ABC subunit C [Verrucomicrobia bacterium]|nr:MAG: excinuclease ABC subunit C [Verrucomicrobiota bacterium]